jgi:hypothetical protein
MQDYGSVGLMNRFFSCNGWIEYVSKEASPCDGYVVVQLYPWFRNPKEEL